MIDWIFFFTVSGWAVYYFVASVWAAGMVGAAVDFLNFYRQPLHTVFITCNSEIHVDNVHYP